MGSPRLVIPAQPDELYYKFASPVDEERAVDIPRLSPLRWVMWANIKIALQSILSF